MSTFRAISLSILMVLVAVYPGLGESSVKPPSKARIQELIQALGAQEYGVRRAAEDELRRFGHAAFDQLLVAQYSESPEIQLAVRELLARLPIKWSRQGPPIVDDIGGRYFRGSAGQKRYYADWLSKLEDGMGFAAVARIVHYEQSDVVSKQAAISLMQNLDREDAGQVEAFMRAVDTIKECPRSAAQWLLEFANEIKTDKPSPQAWQVFAQQEAKLNDARSATFIQAELDQHWADTAIETDDEMGAREAVKHLVELQKKSDLSLALVTTSFWLLEKDQHKLFRELIWDALPEKRTSIPLLVYCDAIIKQKDGDKEAAEKAANEAFAMTEDDIKFGNPFFRAETRLQAARMLEEKEFVDYAIKEYSRMLEVGGNDYQMLSIKGQTANLLSEMLHDRLREKEAAEVLQKFLKKTGKGLLDEFDEFSDEVSRMHFFWSEHHRMNGDREKQIAALNKAVEANDGDADVLIAMHRLPRTDKKWKARTSKLIRQAVDQYEARIQQLHSAGELENRDDLATYLNQVAWLVGNTEGDFEKAVRQSRRSLELRPHSGPSLDTLGRCYFAAGDLKNAIRYQARAVRSMPYSKQILRQLEFFQAAEKTK